MAVRRLVHRAGLRYRVAARPHPELRRTADLVFAGPKVAVFVDGCFWHLCPKHGMRPKSNTDYWDAKLEGNRRRDAEVNAFLKSNGWRVLRFWEHEDPEMAATTIIQTVQSRLR
jgi:DNA mismatch endonuclease (patch repair protein)